MDPDTLAALAAYVREQAVSSARIVELIPDAYAVRCRAGDGSEWHVTTDRYGSAYGWHATLAGALADLAQTFRTMAGRSELRALTAEADGDAAEADRQRHWQRAHLESAARHAERAAAYAAAAQDAAA